MTQRQIQRLIPAVATSDGAGVRLKRSLGQQRGLYHDPFLMLDAFSSDDAADYIAGFPPHPHRGFETVTYMLEGRLLHEDHLGNRGELADGGVQWMRAGSGIIHSEMPQQNEGLMRGFQLWINLPAREKMSPAGYRDIGPEQISRLELPGGGLALVVAGTLAVGEQRAEGPVNTTDAPLSTDPLFAELRLQPGELVELDLADSRNAMLYSFEGSVSVGERSVAADNAALLGPGDTLSLHAGEQGARLLLLAGRPIGEPVVQYGPFVMNSVEEIEQAMADYRDGRLTDPPQ